MTNGYVLTEPASRWEEAALCANGTIGAMVMGFPKDECIPLTHERLFAPQHPRLLPPAMGSRLDEIRMLMEQGFPDEATQIPVRMRYELHHLERTPWVNPIFPACDLRIVTMGIEETQAYSRSLDFSTGLSTVQYRANGVQYTREVFISRADGVGVARLTSSVPARYAVCLQMHPEDPGSASWTRVMADRNLTPLAIDYADGVLRAREHYAKNGVGYEVLAKAAADRVVYQDEWLQVEADRECVILFELHPAATFDNEATCRFRGVEAAYDKLFERHAAMHKGLMDRIRLKLPDNPGLETRFNAGRYESASSCGDYPPLLQGVWTGIYGAPWTGTYISNGNFETSILNLLPAGMPECMYSVFNYLGERMDDFRINAQRMYQCRGIHLSTYTSDNGLEIHFRDPWCLPFWTAGAGWMAHFYYDYWLYTGDDGFFRDVCLPYMKECVAFYEDFLLEDEQGYWKFNPSYSPENNAGGSHSQACINATMDVAVAKELYQNIITGCETLGLEKEQIPKWRYYLSKLPPYQINEDGAISEWMHPAFRDHYDHRHSSHLYPVYYGMQKEIAADPALQAACRQAYELRFRNRAIDSNNMAFGYIQCAQAAVHLGDSEKVNELLDYLAANYYYKTFATSHDAGPSIFNADLSGGFPAIMMEAIAQCYPELDEHDAIRGYRIELLPALPKNMATGTVEGLHLRGGLVLNMSWKDGKVIDYSVSNPLGRTYRVETRQ